MARYAAAPAQPGRQQEPPDGARRHVDAELQQLTGDPWIAPARVLLRQAQNKFANATLDRRPAGGPLRLSPSPPYELSVPTQQRLRSHDQPVPTPRWGHPAERGEECAIGTPERRPRLLPMNHQQLMAQNQQFDILGELATAAAHQ